MILHTAPGEPTHLPDAVLLTPQDRALSSLAHFSTGDGALMTIWEIAALLAQSRTWWNGTALAEALQMPCGEVVNQLGWLVQRGVVQEVVLSIGPSYRLTANAEIRAFLRPLSASQKTD